MPWVSLWKLSLRKAKGVYRPIPENERNQVWGWVIFFVGLPPKQNGFDNRFVEAMVVPNDFCSRGGGDDLI